MMFSGADLQHLFRGEADDAAKRSVAAPIKSAKPAAPQPKAKPIRYRAGQAPDAVNSAPIVEPVLSRVTTERVAEAVNANPPERQKVEAEILPPRKKFEATIISPPIVKDHSASQAAIVDTPIPEDDPDERRRRILAKRNAQQQQQPASSAAEATVSAAAPIHAPVQHTAADVVVRVKGLEALAAHRRTDDVLQHASNIRYPESEHQDKQQGDKEAGDESESGDEEEKEESEEEESKEDEDPYASQMKLFRPVFRSKEERVTLLQAEQEKQRLEEVRKQAEALKEQRMQESRQLVATELQREEAAAKSAADDLQDTAGKPDDTDHPEQKETELAAWRLRELRRLTRDLEAAMQRQAEIAETQRRRNLTDEERAREDAELEKQGLKVFHKDKKKWAFLQRYYHKGAFYMDEDTIAKDAARKQAAADSVDVRLRSADEVAENEAIDKAALPEVLQVKNFGKRGRTKWTHLSKEDTSEFDEYHRTAHRFWEQRAHGRAGGLHNDGGNDAKRARR